MLNPRDYRLSVSSDTPRRGFKSASAHKENPGSPGFFCALDQVKGHPDQAGVEVHQPAAACAERSCWLVALLTAATRRLRPGRCGTGASGDPAVASSPLCFSSKENSPSSGHEDDL